MGFRAYLTTAIFIILLIWGPIDHSLPAWLAIRIGYVILIPLTAGLLLRWIWKQWQPTKKMEITLGRILSGIICITLFVFAVLQAIAKTHIDNTEWIGGGRDEAPEPVGDWIVLPGPNWDSVFILALIGVLFLWLGVIKPSNKTSNGKLLND
ncbi:MAG TPA: hypothetical protein PLS49_06860 [Candidatus Woesebacteria bacterium]|nr:hypothetical protein [Candidatus Woesebacteria bacterium]